MFAAAKAHYRPLDMFAVADGNAYKRGSDGSWQQHGSGGWNKADFSGGHKSAASLDRQQQARSYGNWADAVGDGARGLQPGWQCLGLLQP
jgi:hypothetical protein